LKKKTKMIEIVGSIQKLGTEVHQPLLKKASTCELRGCFALTGKKKRKKEFQRKKINF